MNAAVCVHRILDPEARFTATPDGRLDASGVAHVLDPVDGAALGAAVEACEASDGLVIAFNAGDGDGDGDESEAVLRSALAQGATRAVQIAGDASDPGIVARQLAAAIAREDGIDLVLCGASSSDYAGGATAATIATMLGMPVVYDVVEIGPVEDGRVAATRRRDGGYRELLRVQLPAVLAVDRLVANPRFPTTQARLRANRAEIEVADAAALGIDHTETGASAELTFRPPPPRLHGIPWPATDLNARDRLRFLVQGGAARSGGAGGAVAGSADDVASAIAAFLRERGFVKPAAERESR